MDDSSVDSNEVGARKESAAKTRGLGLWIGGVSTVASSAAAILAAFHGSIVLAFMASCGVGAGILLLAVVHRVVKEAQTSNSTFYVYLARFLIVFTLLYCGALAIKAWSPLSKAIDEALKTSETDASSRNHAADKEDVRHPVNSAPSSSDHDISKVQANIQRDNATTKTPLGQPAGVSRHPNQTSVRPEHSAKLAGTTVQGRRQAVPSSGATSLPGSKQLQPKDSVKLDPRLVKYFSDLLTKFISNSTPDSTDYASYRNTLIDSFPKPSSDALALFDPFYAVIVPPDGYGSGLFLSYCTFAWVDESTGDAICDRVHSSLDQALKGMKSVNGGFSKVLFKKKTTSDAVVSVWMCGEGTNNFRTLWLSSGRGDLNIGGVLQGKKPSINFGILASSKDLPDYIRKLVSSN